MDQPALAVVWPQQRLCRRRGRPESRGGRPARPAAGRSESSGRRRRCRRRSISPSISTSGEAKARRIAIESSTPGSVSIRRRFFPRFRVGHECPHRHRGRSTASPTFKAIDRCFALRLALDARRGDATHVIALQGQEDEDHGHGGQGAAGEGAAPVGLILGRLRAITTCKTCRSLLCTAMRGQ